MKAQRFLALVLASALQLLPVLRPLFPAPASVAAPAWAFVLRMSAGTVAFLSSYHAVSGATSINPPYTVVTNTGAVYNRFLSTSVRIAESWSASTAAKGSAVFPLTPGLWLTNSNGRIGGIPTWTGTSNITISAWEFTGNSGNFVSSVFTFTINPAGPPGIGTQPFSQIYNPGATASFTVSAYGAVPLSYQWRLAGTNIAGATTNSYTRTNLALTDAGAYTVVVTNSLGAITSAVANLTVKSPPIISAQPTNLLIRVGVPATFSVTATGFAPLTYQWRFNGSNIAGAISSAYTIPAVQSFNSGLYSVAITNSVGFNISSNALLTVIVPEVNLQPVISGGALAVSFNAEVGTNYVVQTSSDLRNWSTLTNLLAGATNLTFSDSLSNPGRFYRVNRPSN